MAIYIHDEAARLRLRVTDELNEPAVRELASCWTTALSVIGSRTIVLDLTGLSSIADAGRQILEELHRYGVEFLAQTEFQLQLVAGITRGAVSPNARDRGVGRWLKGVLGTA